jgi:hypothetical protein
MSSQRRRLAVLASTIGVLAVGAPAGALAKDKAPATDSTPASDSTPAISIPCGAAAPSGALPNGMTFVPPAVGPIHVSIAPTILLGKVTDPGLNVSTPGWGGGFPTVNCTPGS